MAYSALMQKLQYHAKKNGLKIRKIGNNYVMTEIQKKEFASGFLTLEQLKEKILELQVKKLKKSFAV